MKRELGKLLIVANTFRHRGLEFACPMIVDHFLAEPIFPVITNSGDELETICEHPVWFETCFLRLESFFLKARALALIRSVVREQHRLPGSARRGGTAASAGEQASRR